MRYLNSFIKDLNKAGRFFRKYLGKNSLSFEHNDWHVHSVQENWEYKYKRHQLGEVQEEKHSGAVLSWGFRRDTENTLMFIIDIPERINKIFRDATYSSDFKYDLGSFFFNNNLKITYDQYLDLLVQYQDREGKPPILNVDKLGKALNDWVNSNNYKKAVEYGNVLDTLSKSLPSFYKKSPSNLLYRTIAVEKLLLDRVKNGKKLVLRNRKYSSWTYNIETAKSFRPSENLFLSPKYTLVILERNFTDDEIVLNVRSLGEALDKMHKLEGVTWKVLIKEEDEILIKNVKRNFTFKTSEIAYYGELLPSGFFNWHPFSEILRK